LSENSAGITGDLVVTDNLRVFAVDLGPLVLEMPFHFDLEEVLTDFILSYVRSAGVFNQNSSRLIILDVVAF
jgi:hypothetical protein